MPLLRISTAKQVTREDQEKILTEASSMVSKELGKPEGYVMTQFEGVETMTFAGSTEPACFLQLKSIGLPEAKTKELSAALCDFVDARLGIARNRVYIEFFDAPRTMWGFNSSTFG